MNKPGHVASLAACGGRPACEEDAGRLECLPGRGSECADLGIAAASAPGIKDGSMLAPSVLRGPGCVGRDAFTTGWRFGALVRRGA